jgi:DNA-binding NarL/FixJ family response regulator
MPVLNGPDATTKIRSLGFRGKIFGVTGNTLPADIEDFSSRGLDEILLKPLNNEELVRILMDAVQKQPLMTTIIEGALFVFLIMYTHLSHHIPHLYSPRCRI